MTGRKHCFQSRISCLWCRILYPEETEEYKGAARGTAYHRLMECLDYTAVDSESQIHKQITALTEAKKMAYEEAQCIRIQDIMTFLHSEIGQRMKKAFEADQLYREQPFVLAQSMKNIEKDWNGEETVLVQGIIDAYFIEDEEIVLVDYKTDRVRKVRTASDRPLSYAA